MSELGSSSCFPRSMIAVYVSLSVVDGAIAILAFCQLLRMHSRNAQLGWTRQKVLHLMIGLSNLGYVIYFALTLTAICEGWKCWAYSCGFIFMAVPKILHLAAFMLILSFWVDICHQDDDEDNEKHSSHEVLLDSMRGSSVSDSRQMCVPVSSRHVGSRQRIVVLVTVITCVLMILFAVLIWIRAGKNAIDSSVLARVYVDVYAIGILFLGGALACYGIIIYMRLSHLRSESSSSEMWKVMGLATISLVCFAISSLVALLTDIPVLYRWRQHYAIGGRISSLAVLYYLIGSSVPSAFVLLIMRELPPTVAPFKIEESRRGSFIFHGSSSPIHPHHWTLVACSRNQAPKVSPI